MPAARLKDYYAGKAKERMLAGRKIDNPPENFPEGGDARDQAAAKFGISGKSVDDACNIIKRGTPGLVAKVNTGDISLNEGKAIAAMPKARQKQVATLPSRTIAPVTARAPMVKPSAASAFLATRRYARCVSVCGRRC